MIPISRYGTVLYTLIEFNEILYHIWNMNWKDQHCIASKLNKLTLYCI